MKRKLIALDLDGTTLNDASLISQKTEKILVQLQKQGHLVSIVTGRPYRISKSFYKQLGLNTPIVNFNGALCHIPGSPAWEQFFHQPLETDLAMDLLERQEEFGVNWMCMEGKESLYSSHETLPVSAYFPESTLSSFITSQSVLKEQPTAVTLFVDKEKQETARNKILEHYGSNLISVRPWGGSTPCLEIVSAGIQKAVGIEVMARHYDIQKADILAFGDEDNDLEMIDYAGHGVAMQNAIEPLKKIADDITNLTNDEDGLADYLSRYFKL